MEESVPPPSSSGKPQQVSEESLQVASEAPPNVDSSTRQQPGEMEFAQPPSNQHYGSYGNPTTIFDMSDLSASLPHYAQSQYPTQFLPQVTQVGPIHPNLAYASIANQQWVSQIASQYAQQYHSHTQSSFSGYEMNVANSNAEMHARRHGLPQQHIPYTINMMPQQPYQNYHPQQGSYIPQQLGQYEHRANMQYHMAARAQTEHYNPQSNMIQRENLGSPHDNTKSMLQVSTALRGPPRKAKQSGHALWVGNLPPGTNIIDLKDHLARDATDDIQSVFLIAKTNCAFVNYKTAESCAAAMLRFHDSRFRQMRLVCRLRRGSSPNSATEYSQGDSKENLQLQLSDLDSPDTTQDTQNRDLVPSVSSSTAERLVKEKFFIIKSLTREDVDRAVATGTWATQAQNEENLNLAYATAENVYLIFSVNKSSEYYGYARMDSPISGDVQSARETTPQPKVSPVANDGPTIIPTPATSTAPRGYIVDDSARGNIFWEAESEVPSPVIPPTSASLTPGETSGEESTPELTPQPSNVGRPFKITWKSTEKLPFIRTRGLRNPWNSNREIKIARDGTEVEPTIGRRLITMFEQQAQMTAAAMRQPSMNMPPQPQMHVSYGGMMSHGGYAYNVPGLSPPSYGRLY